MKIRLDQLLVDRGYAESETKAQALILSGAVLVPKAFGIIKPGTKLDSGVLVTILNTGNKYVSRGGLKLAPILSGFQIDVQDKIAVDIGASTGGFTDCLLQHGAKRVYAVDVGYGQLHAKLRKNPLVTVMERKNARYLEPSDFSEPFDIAVIDVSFISLTKILPAVIPLLKEPAELIALIKPQFEIPKPLLDASRGQKKKGGVVRDQNLRDLAVDRIRHFAEHELGLQVIGVAPSVLTGPAGNQEYFIYLRKTAQIITR